MNIAYGAMKSPAVELGVLMQTARRFADWNIARGAIFGGQETSPFSI